jgi:hypothetical protein
MPPEITGSANIHEGSDVIGPAAPPYTYLGVARQLAPGVALLAQAGAPLAIPLCLLAAHEAECLLKAYLSRGGSDSKVMMPDVRHNLEKLWSMAVSEGLSLSMPPPPWLQCLGLLHNRPFHLRYSKGVHGIAMPGNAEIASGTAELMAIVERNL